MRSKGFLKSKRKIALAKGARGGEVLLTTKCNSKDQHIMKTFNSLNTFKKYSLALLLGGALCATVSLRAADVKSYQVTGPVLALTPTTITVQKGEDKWEIARNGSTKIQGDLKVGAKVTIYYTMVAGEVEVKGKAEKKK